MKSFYAVLRCVALSALLVAMTACTKDEKPKNFNPTPPPQTANEEINMFVDAYLQAYYLWNEEYQTLTLNYDQSYDNFLTNTLMSMKTNTFDKKMRNGYWQLYSYIQKLSSAGYNSVSSRGVGHGISKEMYYGFGFMKFVATEYQAEDGMAYALVVEGVYPDTPAAEAGIHRGTTILKVNGQSLTRSNIQNYANTLIYPTNNKTIELTLNDENSEPVQITSKAIYENPVLCSKVIEQGGKKIGYLAYSGFEAAYDDDVLSAFESFKAAGVNDMILDLRMNGGGHVITAKMISTCIGGNACQGQVFQYYRYNDARMETPEATATQTNMTYDSSKKLFYEKFAYDEAYFGVDLKPYALDLPRVYVIVSNNTASSSEAVIGSLKGVGVDVILIGSTTNGKNVGMEPTSFTTSTGQFYLCPITFQTYNAMGDSVDPNGIAPNYPVDDWGSNGYSDFGEAADPCIAQALTLITGEAPASLSRKAVCGLDLRMDQSINLPNACGPKGMLMLPREMPLNK